MGGVFGDLDREHHGPARAGSNRHRRGAGGVGDISTAANAETIRPMVVQSAASADADSEGVLWNGVSAGGRGGAVHFGRKNVGRVSHRNHRAKIGQEVSFSDWRSYANSELRSDQFVSGDICVGAADGAVIQHIRRVDGDAESVHA